MNEKIEIVSMWIEKADHDLGSAEIIFLHLPEFNDTITFHCQQAVEKYIKSYLTFSDIPFKKSHNLTYLLGLITQKESISDVLYDSAAELEDYAVDIRYPDTTIELTDEDIKRAIDIAKNFRTHFLTLMNLKID